MNIYCSHELGYGLPQFKVDNVKDALELAANTLSNIGEKYVQEALFIITVGGDDTVRTVRLLALGTYNSVPISTNEICKQAVKDAAKSILILHCHPGSDATLIKPSENDIRITDRLLQACSLLDIYLIDHIIIGDNFVNDHYFYSMRKNSALNFDQYIQADYIKDNFAKEPYELNWRK